LRICKSPELAEVEGQYEVTCVSRESFIVQLPDRDLILKRHGKLHVRDFGEEYNALATEACTKAEISRAQEAQELLCMCGYPSYQEAVSLLQDGNIVNLQNLSAADIGHAYDLYG
jgi:hypothetical protein